MDEIPFDINEDEILSKPIEEEKPSKLKKAALVIMAFMLFFLIISYSVAFLGMDSIPGLVKSRQMDSSGIELNDIILMFSSGIYDEIVSYAAENEGVETKFCLLGEKQGNNILITSVFKPLIIAQDFKSVTSKSCPSGTMVSVHTHPLLHCVPSLQDYKALHSSGDAEFTAVMCEKGRFYFY
ncbi:MAG: hypothetical protein KJ955_04910 [Nanoarchaeota archaeon]|nr:hypothetical protein [Nanoarchaeota archaeon]